MAAKAKAGGAAPVMLDRQAILAAQDLPTETVEVPEWGGAVRVRMMTGTERDAFDGWIMSALDGGAHNTRAYLCAKCIVGEDGAPLFTEADMDVLGAKSSAALDRVCAVARRLNKLRKEDIEDAEKN